MNSSRKAGRQALAAFFSGLGAQRGHWYSVILSSSTGASDERHSAAFPPLSKLASVGEAMMRNVLLHCGLVQFRRGSGHSVLLQQWQDFILEYLLDDVEVTHFTIAKKKRIYIRLGSWNSSSHKRRTPAKVWSSACSGNLRVPRLRTSSLSNILAQVIGTLEITFCNENSTITAVTSDSESSASNTEFDDEEDSVGETEVQNDAILPDSAEFPLLHSLFLMHKRHNLLDHLLNEIVRFYHGSEIIFKRGNNMDTTLIAVPSFRSLYRYKKELQEKDLMIDSAVKAILRSSKSSLDDACEAILFVMYHKFEEPFLSVAVTQGVANGIPPKVMDEVSVEAMLSEAGVNWTNARILFRHLKQFFGRSMVVSEKKRRDYFGSNDFPPEVDRETFPDKTIVSYWWKLPELLLKHQINQMVTPTDLNGIQHVDICTGGDHGAGRFRMLLKLLKHLKPTGSMIPSSANIYMLDAIEIC